MGERGRLQMNPMMKERLGERPGERPGEGGTLLGQWGEKLRFRMMETRLRF